MAASTHAWTSAPPPIGAQPRSNPRACCSASSPPRRRPDAAIVTELNAKTATAPFRQAVVSSRRGTVHDYKLMADDMRFSATAVAAPVRWWHSDTDTFVPPQRAREYARELPSCELTMIPGAGHYLHHRNIDDVLAHGSA